MKSISVLAVLLLPFLSVHAGEKTETNLPARICVMDFVNPDITGQEKFLNFENKKIQINSACTLNNADRNTMNSVMQGYVRMIDANDLTRTNAVNREFVVSDNAFNRTKTLDLYHTVVKGHVRPLLLGSEYMAGFLSRHPDVFATYDTRLMLAAMNKLQYDPDFPSNFMLRLAQETGATHILYGTIADIHSKLKSFKGYGIETKTMEYTLDIMIRLVDLPAQKIVYSGVYTGVLRESDMGTGGLEIDFNKYQTLMKSALEKAAEDLYARFDPKNPDALKVTPIPAGKNPVSVQKTLPPPAVQKTEPETAAEQPVIRKDQKEVVIIQQSLNPVQTEEGIHVPPPPVVTPSAASPHAAVIVNPASGNRNNSPVIVIQPESVKK